MVTLEVSSVQCEETVKYPCPRPVVLGILGAMALLLALWWSFVREGSEAVTLIILGLCPFKGVLGGGVLYIVQYL